MKHLVINLVLSISPLVFSQVGIGNTDPKATLDISSSNIATPNNTDGILIRKIDNFPRGINKIIKLVYLPQAFGTSAPKNGINLIFFHFTIRVELSIIR